MSTLHLEGARSDTPGCAHVMHFNNAGSSLPPRPVVQAQIDHLTLEATIGGYEAAEQNHEQIEHTYTALAKLIGAQPSEIAFVENATRAWDAAFYSIDFKPGDRILTSRAEYASNYIAFLHMARRRGVQIGVVPVTRTGELDVDALDALMDERVRLIAVTHIPTNGGLVNPAAEIGRVARRHGVLFLLDACQSVGQLPLDVNEIGCDLLSATGRKYLRGPRGTGFLFVRSGVVLQLDPPMLDLHAATWTGPDEYTVRGDARRFENWEGNVAGKLALGVAADYALTLGLPVIWQRIHRLAGLLREGLSALSGVNVRDIGRLQCGIVTFTIEGRAPEYIQKSLAAQGINVTTSSIFGTRLDMTARGLAMVVRASLHYYNSEDEVVRFCDAIGELSPGSTNR